MGFVYSLCSHMVRIVLHGQHFYKKKYFSGSCFPYILLYKDSNLPLSNVNHIKITTNQSDRVQVLCCVNSLVYKLNGMILM